MIEQRGGAVVVGCVWLRVFSPDRIRESTEAPRGKEMLLLGWLVI